MGVWIETFIIFYDTPYQRSHPTWVCGLKPYPKYLITKYDSHTLRGCVDWNIYNINDSGLGRVTPYVGVWIETINMKYKGFGLESHPTWVCGLKPSTGKTLKRKVESHPTWVCGLKPLDCIFNLWSGLSHPTWVCGLKRLFRYPNIVVQMSHPTWVCGLKRYQSSWIHGQPCHTLRGCVDWNWI